MGSLRLKGLEWFGLSSTSALTYMDTSVLCTRITKLSKLYSILLNPLNGNTRAGPLIHYCPGKRNSNADALSRSPLTEEAAFGIISAFDGCDLRKISDLSALQRGDPELAAIIKFIETGVLAEDGEILGFDTVSLLTGRWHSLSCGSR